MARNQLTMFQQAVIGRWWPFPALPAGRLWALLLGALAAEVAVAYVTVEAPVAVGAAAVAGATLLLGVTIARRGWFGLATLPTIALVGVAALGTNVLQDELTVLPILGGFFRLPEILLLVVVMVWLAEGLVARRLRLPRSPVLLVLWLFLLWALVALVVSMFRSPDLVKPALHDFRTYLFLAFAFPVAGVVRRWGQVRLLAACVALFGGVQALMLIGSYVVGRPLDVRWLTGTEGISAFLNINVDDQYGYVVLALVMVISLMAFAPSAHARLALIGAAITLGVAVLLSFTRALWFSAAAATALVVLALPSIRRGASFGLMGVVAVVVGGAAFPVVTQVSGFPLMSWVGERLAPTALGSEDTHILSRLLEVQSLLGYYVSSPIWGTGLGSTFTVQRAFGFSDVTYAHNGYVFTLVQLGAVGLFLNVLFVYLFLVKAFRLYRSIEDSLDKGFVMGLIAGFLFILIANVGASWAGRLSYMIYLGLSIGLLEAAHELLVPGGERGVGGVAVSLPSRDPSAVRSPSIDDQKN